MVRLADMSAGILILFFFNSWYMLNSRSWAVL